MSLLESVIQSGSASAHAGTMTIPLRQHPDPYREHWGQHEISIDKQSSAYAPCGAGKAVWRRHQQRSRNSPQPAANTPRGPDVDAEPVHTAA